MFERSPNEHILYSITDVQMHNCECSIVHILVHFQSPWKIHVDFHPYWPMDARWNRRSHRHFELTKNSFGTLPTKWFPERSAFQFLEWLTGYQGSTLSLFSRISMQKFSLRKLELGKGEYSHQSINMNLSVFIRFKGFIRVHWAFNSRFPLVNSCFKPLWWVRIIDSVIIWALCEFERYLIILGIYHSPALDINII